jgi:hypothetical protein
VWRGSAQDASLCAVRISFGPRGFANDVNAVRVVVAHGSGCYGRWRGPSHALVGAMWYLAAVVDWGSWPRNGTPDCPASLEMTCREINTAAHSPGIASLESAHHPRRGRAALRVSSDVLRAKRMVKQASCGYPMSAVASDPLKRPLHLAWSVPKNTRILSPYSCSEVWHSK